MLTGESVPILKQSLHRTDKESYDPETDKKHTLFSGTEVIWTRAGAEKALGVVTKTGYDTTKGLLVKSILFPWPSKFKFHWDSMLFACALGFIAFIGMLANLPVSLKYLSAWMTFRRFMDLITIAIPPALPAAMTSGVILAVRQLKRWKIFCIDPPRINVAGRVSIMVFDKTGTLTEEGLSVSGFKAVTEHGGNYKF